MEKISVVIITLNEEANLERCIESVKPVADEILVLDSFSTDQTVLIARQKGATVYQQHFKGYIEQKNTILGLAKHDFVLSLDADEALSPELTHSILLAKEHFDYTAYSMNRCNSYCGSFIRHGLWYPDKKIRLFDKKFARWGGSNPHDKIVLKEKVPVGSLRGDLLHYCYHSIEEHKSRNEEISAIAAASLLHDGCKMALLKQYLSPAWRFIKGYILKRGFLDGKNGWVIANLTAKQAYLKYSKLRKLRNKNKHMEQHQPVNENMPVSFSDPHS